MLPARKLIYSNFYGVDVKPNVMNLKEICAEKIRAMNERFRYRDFYDFGAIMQEVRLDLKEVVDLLLQKELRKPLSLKNIMQHWQLASQAKAKELSLIYVAREIDDIEPFLKAIPLD